MVSQIAHAGMKVFNKAGYRLLRKITGQTVKNMPPEAVTMNTAIIEHVSGKQKYVFTFLNSNGKALKVVHSTSDSPLVKETVYSWVQPQQRTKMTAMYREKIDPCAFENYGVRKNTKIWDKNTKNITETKDTVIDINKNSNTVTISEASRRESEDLTGVLYTDEASLYQIVNGKKVKGLYQKSHCRPNEVSTIEVNSGCGLTEGEIQQALEYPYFYAMFKNPQRMAYAARTRAFADQKIDTATNFAFVPKERLNGAHAVYNMNTDTIYLSGQRMSKSSLLNDLNHEARHKWQFGQIKKLENSELTTTEEIQQARIFRENMQNYKSHSKCANEGEYSSQPVEFDAYAIGDAAAERHYVQVDFLQKLFPKAARKTLGE